MTFSACETRHCVNVTIIDDSVGEPDESFSYTLERTLGLDPRITLTPSDGEAVIVDDDCILQPQVVCVTCYFIVVLYIPPVAVVGLERTFYSISEDVGAVEVCAVVTRPNIDCPIEFTFTIHISTVNETAGCSYNYITVNLEC